MRHALCLETATMAVFMATVSTVTAAPAADTSDASGSDVATPAPAAAIPAGGAATTTGTGNVVTVQSAGNAPSAELAGVIRTDRIDFTGPVKDTYSQYEWMVAEIDFEARDNPNPAAPNPRWISDVEVTLTIGWGSKNPSSPQIDLALTSSVKLFAVELNRKSAVFFFVPPEVLQRGIRGRSIVSRQPPSFYVVQYRVGGVPQKITKFDVSTSLPDSKWWDGFLASGAGKMGAADWLMNAAQAPHSVVTTAMSRVPVGTPIPTYLPNRDAGR